MHNYSENWRHLKSILSGYSTSNRSPELYSYTDHTQAKALAIFLTHAALATPKLDRTTVEAVLTAQQPWPHTPGTPQFEGVSLPLSLLEEYGLVAFYAGWCTVHCQPLKSLDNLDQSLIPLLQAVEHLKDICYGQNGYIQPHYTCPADELKRLLAEHFGSTPVAQLLPELRLEHSHFKLPPGNQNFSSLVSTYLWQILHETFEPKEAFERWILCLRVNCSWAMPVLFDDGDYEQRTEFNNQLLAYLTQDTALSLPMDTLQRQFFNQHNFSSILTPVESRVQIAIDAEGKSRSEHQDIVVFERPKLATLRVADALPCIDDSSDLQLVRSSQLPGGHWREFQLFYAWLLACTVEASIRIDGQLLASYGFAEKMLELAASRPILKHLLFNLLPDCESVAYKIFLLSQPATCDIALFYLTQQSFSNSPRDSQLFTQYFDKGYQQLVCHEYLRTIEAEPDSGDRLLKVVEFLGERCDLHTRDFSKRYEYQFLLCLLDKLNHQRVVQLGQAFVQWCAGTKKTPIHQPQQHYWYLLGFWLIERLENAGIDPTGTLSCSLRASLIRCYREEFEENLAGNRRSLEPNDFFSALPWHKLIWLEGVGELLTLSNRCSDWQEKLSHLNNNFAAAAAIRHYLQVLMCLGRPQRISKDWGRVANRVVEIVRTLGFGPREQATYLFDIVFYVNKYDLWPPFCSYTNLFQDNLYDEFVERCVPLIPLNQLFVLLERCTVIARTQKLQEVIANRQSPESEDLGLSGLEEAFISAWDTGNTDLASKLIASAKAFLAQERFARTNIPRILRARKVWLSHEYKWQLMIHLENSKQYPKKFEEAAYQIPLPHENSKPSDDDVRAQWQECERFRRYIIAAANCETDPERCVGIMEKLYNETKYSIHSFMLFKGRIVLYEINRDTTGLRHALSQFLGSIGNTEPEHMPTIWVATILDAYRQLQDSPGIDNFWMRLEPDQQARREILHPYCKALMARGEALIAQQIITRYRELNLQASDGLGITDLIDELGKVLPSERSMSQLIEVINEDSQRSTQQLAKHYSQIVSKDFEDYVAIVGQGKQPHEFLKDTVLEVAQELLLRKKNLQLQSRHANVKKPTKITHENLINDWFTSLFDKRMAEARVGFRDNKRGGESESGKSPGEIDGYITHAKNKRIAIFEAFRLFSLDTTVISLHLNKIALYDKESLNPVFIAAYCDVTDFAELVRGYSAFIATQNYTDFTIIPETGNTVQTLDDTDHLWLGMERRRRDRREIIFYHLLLNMRT